MTEIVTAACEMNCLKTSDYVDLFYTTLAEFPGLILTVFLVELLGRRLTIFSTLLLFGIFTGLLNLCASRTVLVALFFAARLCISATFQAVYIYTPEVGPLIIR